MFIALNEKGRLINLLSLTKEEKQNIMKKTFYCPQCHEPLIIKNGLVKKIHFAHKASNCLLTVNESEAHLLAKEQLFKFFENRNISVEMEHVIHSTNQRSDLFFKISNICFAIEFQHSTISFEKMKERIENYQKETIKQIWLVDPKIMKKKGNVIKLQPFLYEILKLEYYNYLRLYCPYKEGLTILHSILYIQSTKIIATEHTTSLKHSSISIFLSINPQKQYNFQAFFRQIEKEKKNILLYYKQYHTFVFLLYENNIELMHAWWIGLPTKFNCMFDTNCIIWQGFLFVFWKKANIFTLNESTEWLESLLRNGAIRIRSEEIQIIKKAVEQYLDLLVSLNIMRNDVNIYYYNELFVERDNNYLYKVLEKVL